jgi:hypothetical protein
VQFHHVGKAEQEGIDAEHKADNLFGFAVHFSSPFVSNQRLEGRSP